jgi:hypothetical protein
MSCQSKFRRLDVGRCADITFSGKGKEELFSYAILKSRGNIGFLKFACDIKSAIRGSFVSMYLFCLQGFSFSFVSTMNIRHSMSLIRDTEEATDA